MKRQRQRREARKFLEDSRSLWAFQVLLLILIFFTWLIWDRIFPIFTLTTSDCVELAVSFGSREGLPHIYTLLVYTTGLLVLFWAAIAFTFRRAFRHWMTYALQLALLISLVFLFSDFRAMRVDGIIPPDGTLAVQPMIMDNSVSPPQFFPVEYWGSDGGHWEFAESRNRISNWGVYRSPECVWLDRNLITQNSTRDIPEDADASDVEKERLIQERNYNTDDWNNIAFFDLLKISAESTFGGMSLMELLQTQQSYRPLSAEERVRFLRKQDCMKNQIYATGHNQKCQYIWIPVWEINE
jgi:hypothetical protein